MGSTGRPEAPLTNPRSERVKKVAALAGRSARSRHGRFLVEGPQAVREIVAHAPDHVRDLYLAEAMVLRHHDIVEIAAEAGIRLHEADERVMRAMSPDCQGVLAVAGLSAVAAPALTDLLAASPTLVVLLTAANDPGNAGTVLRTADAAGADAVLLGSGSVEVTNPKVVRSTAGSLFHLPVLGDLDVADTVRGARAAGLQVLAADGAGEWDVDELADRTFARAHRLGLATSDELSATSLVAPDLAAPTLWLVGNEAHGLHRAERDLADAVVKVPIHGAAESLNLAGATALCLYASARAQRREVG
jgi:TrmH family RNA methyltransferase